MNSQEYTIGEYLQGLLRNITVDDAALKSICARSKVVADTPYTDCTDEEIKTSTAWLYVWVATSPTQSEKVKDADGDWSHEEGGETMSAEVLSRFLRMANEIFTELGMPTVGTNKWGFHGSGFRNIRNYGQTSRNLR